MKKLVAVMAGVVLIGLSSSAFAEVSQDDAKKVYDRAFGRGCDTCHTVEGNPKLTANIAAGTLTRATFEEVLRKGRNGMPAAMADIMKVGAVKDKPEAEVLDALFEYIKNR